MTRTRSDRIPRESLSFRDKLLTKVQIERFLKQAKANVSFYEETLKNWPDDKEVGRGLTAIQVLTESEPNNPFLQGFVETRPQCMEE